MCKWPNESNQVEVVVCVSEQVYKLTGVSWESYESKWLYRKNPSQCFREKQHPKALKFRPPDAVASSVSLVLAALAGSFTRNPDRKKREGLSQAHSPWVSLVLASSCRCVRPSQEKEAQHSPSSGRGSWASPKGTVKMRSARAVPGSLDKPSCTVNREAPPRYPVMWCRQDCSCAQGQLG